jgi:hypothetical protein
MATVAVIGDIHRHPLSAQTTSDGIGQRLLVLDDENAHPPTVPHLIARLAPAPLHLRGARSLHCGRVADRSDQRGGPAGHRPGDILGGQAQICQHLIPGGVCKEALWDAEITKRHVNPGVAERGGQ